MGVIGVLLILGAIGQCYNVLFNAKSKEYWETTFLGGKFKQGCLIPVFIFAIGIGMAGYEDKTNSKNKNDDIKVYNILMEKYETVLKINFNELKEFIDDNHKIILTMDIRKKENFYKLLILEIETEAKKNKELSKEMEELKVTNMKATDISYKINEKKKEISRNEKKIEVLLEGKEYWQEVFNK